MTILEAGRVQAMMVTLYKCLHGMAPPYPGVTLKLTFKSGVYHVYVIIVFCRFLYNYVIRRY